MPNWELDLIWVWGALEGCKGRVGMGPQGTSLCWQEATSCLSKSKELMEAVLRDPGLLGLQREGGATLARLQRDASRLDFSPDVRYRQTSRPFLLHPILFLAQELGVGTTPLRGHIAKP